MSCDFVLRGPTCAAASRSGPAAAFQDSSLFAGGGQFFYDAETTQDFQYPEHVELIQDNPIAGGSSTLAGKSCVEHDTRSQQIVRSGGQIFLDRELLQDYHTCVSVGSDEYHQETIKTRAGQRSAAGDNDQDTKKTREGQRSVSTASPPPETHWSKEENKEPERPFPRHTPPSARSGLPGPPPSTPCASHGAWSRGGQIFSDLGGMDGHPPWEDCVDEASHGVQELTLTSSHGKPQLSIDRARCASQAHLDDTASSPLRVRLDAS